MNDDKNFLTNNMSAISDIWKELGSPERKKLEEIYRQYGDKNKAILDILQGRESFFGGKPTKTVDIRSDRDVYRALKSVYDNTGNMEDVIITAKYNQIPVETLNKFVKDGKLVKMDARGDERAGALARGATDNLYGGFLNEITGGAYSKKYSDVLPEGIDYEDAEHTAWRAGINQAKAYRNALKKDSKGVEYLGEALGMVAPISIANKLTKGIKAATDASKLAKTLAVSGRGFATGAITSIPGSITQETPADALKNTLYEAGLFSLGDTLLYGAGSALGAGRKMLAEAGAKIAKPETRYIESFKIKPLEEMSAAEKARGIKNGWIKDGKLIVSRYLAEERGLGAKEIMTDLWKASRENENVYKQLREELKDFHYIDEVKKIAKESMIESMPASKVNKILKSIPKRLDDFIEGGAKNYESLTGEQLANSLAAFNTDIKRALNNLKGLKAAERNAVEDYLQKLNSKNMLEFMKKAMPTRFDIKDYDKSLIESMAKTFNITNPITQGVTAANFLQRRKNRQFMDAVMSGKKPPKTPALQRLLETKESERLQNLTRDTLREIIKTTRKE